MSTTSIFRYPPRLVYGTVREGQEAPKGFIAVVGDVTLTASTPYEEIWQLLNGLATDDANQAALALLKEMEDPWVYKTVADPDHLMPACKKVVAAVRRLDLARLEVARQTAVDSTEYEDWFDQLPPQLRQAFETPLDLATPNSAHRGSILDAFRTLRDLECQLETTRPKPKGSNRAAQAKKAERRLRDQKRTERTKAGGKGNKVA